MAGAFASYLAVKGLKKIFSIELPTALLIGLAVGVLAWLITAPMIRIAFPRFADGRGFTLAAILRRAGYTGRLRAHGHVIADQYAMARRAGFDEVEIDDTLAARQPEDQWLARANWQDHNYQAALRG